MAQTLKILIDVYTSRIVRGQSTQKDVIDVIKLLVKKDDMLDSLDGKECGYDNSTNGINFTIRKVDLFFSMFSDGSLCLDIHIYITTENEQKPS